MAGDEKDSVPFISTFPVSDQVIDVIVQGDTAYLAAGEDGLVLVDITDPASPTEISSVLLGGEAWDLAIHETTVFVAKSLPYHGLQIVDISNPSMPILVGTLDRIDFSGKGVAVTEDGSTVFLVGHQCLVRPSRPSCIPTLAFGVARGTPPLGIFPSREIRV